MRFFHISDLHFGKQLYGYDLTEEHRNFIRQLGKYCEEYSPDAVLIAGDIYDRAVPSAGAVTLMDELLMTLSGITVLIISGNHDNAQRLNYGNEFLRKHNIYISSMPPVEDLKMEKISLLEAYNDRNQDKRQGYVSVIPGRNRLRFRTDSHNRLLRILRCHCAYRIHNRPDLDSVCLR